MINSYAARHDEGFTLVELMVSIVLLGMLSLALYAGLDFGMRAWRRAADSGPQFSRISIARTTLSNLLTSAYPLMIRASGQDAHIDFDGEPNRVTFLTPAAAEMAPGGFARTTIQFEEDGGSFALVSYAKAELGNRSAVRHILLHGVGRLSISYFGTDKPNRAGEWLPEWRDRLRLPSLIRIQLSLAAPNSPNWPDLIIRPRIVADATCSFDPLTKSCRGL